MVHQTLSVAMCTFNGARYLPEQLTSIASQDRAPDEVVICDDGSTDETIAIVSEFAQRSPFPVRVVVNSERLGPTKNFAKAIALCGGDIIFLSDQDDVWKPQKVTTLASALESHPSAVYTFSDADMVNESGLSLGYSLWDAVGLRRNLSKFPDSQLPMLLKKSLVTGATMAFRGSFRNVLLPVPPTWMHDGWLECLGSALSRGIAVPENLMSYRRHSTQACGWRSKTFWQVCRTSLSSSADDSWAKVNQFRALLDRVNASFSRFPGADDSLELLREKEAHLLQRARTRSSGRVTKAAKVAQELVNGRYRRFSESFWYSVIRDLC